ncbi:unnamed protein product [Cuscuta campestris]|uniref:Thioredoxin-like fold domain-containing protein n=1 Tax=Cuscuta campestris TaxID=132261 RepID=A0A484MY82_9ASTE|nr:unnamed protein product [Cuscuta campestris]
MENLEGNDIFFPAKYEDEKKIFTSTIEGLLSSEEPPSKRFRLIKGKPQVIQKGRVKESTVKKFDTMKPVYPDDMEVVPITIKKGEYIDVISLLSSNKSSDANSNYLLRSKSFDQVQVESLKGKYVCLCCFVVPVVLDGCQACLAQSFSQLSHELSSRNDFEMVLVIKMKQPWKDEKAVFDHFMSAFNCLVVPYEHAFQRDKICMSLKRLSFGLGGFIVDPNQNVVQERIWCLHHCGGGAFPFTDDKLLLYFNRNWESKSIEELLLAIPLLYFFTR